MAIFRVNKNKDYTVMSNYHLRDANMSFKAKGLLSMMLSLPDDWDYSIKGIISISKENKTSIQSALKELEENKYLKRTKKQNEKGQFEYIYDIYEKPWTENPYIENLVTDYPCTENMPQINTNIQNTKKQNTKKQNTDIKSNNTPYNPSTDDSQKYDNKIFEKFWNEYPKKISKGNAEKWFKKNKPTNDLVDLMIEKLKIYKETEQWKKDNGKYIPYPSSWLNAKGWEDEIQANNIKQKYDTSIVYHDKYIGDYRLDENGGRIFV